MARNHLNSSPKEPTPSSGLLSTCTHTNRTIHTHTHIIFKVFLSNNKRGKTSVLFSTFADMKEPALKRCPNQKHTYLALLLLQLLEGSSKSYLNTPGRRTFKDDKAFEKVPPALGFSSSFSLSMSISSSPCSLMITPSSGFASLTWHALSRGWSSEFLKRTIEIYLK